MKTTVNFSQFCDAFNSMGRENQFSYEGKKALFDYLEQYEDDTGEEIELDIIALCCDYSEETPEEIAQSYDIEIEGDIAEHFEPVLKHLEYHTQVIGTTEDSIIYQVY